VFSRPVAAEKTYLNQSDVTGLLWPRSRFSSCDEISDLKYIGLLFLRLVTKVYDGAANRKTVLQSSQEAGNYLFLNGLPEFGSIVSQAAQESIGRYLHLYCKGKAGGIMAAYGACRFGFPKQDWRTRFASEL
jgi:hypothetical protein